MPRDRRGAALAASVVVRAREETASAGRKREHARIINARQAGELRGVLLRLGCGAWSGESDTETVRQRGRGMSEMWSNMKKMPQANENARACSEFEGDVREYLQGI